MPRGRRRNVESVEQGDVREPVINPNPERVNNTENETRTQMIKQKQFSLKQQLNELNVALSNSEVDVHQAQLRLERVTNLFYAYEELHDELSIIAPEEDTLNIISAIRFEYYELATKVNDLTNSNNVTNDRSCNHPMGHSTFVERQKQYKLPVAEIPKFDGSPNTWLSFSNSFVAMVDSRSDINDVVKLMYLKNCVQGAAAKKIAHILITPENYQEAWETLKRSYEKKRIVISKYLDNLIDIKAPATTNAEGISDIVTNVNLCLTSLNSLGVTTDAGLERVAIRIIERILPGPVREDWEKSLSLEELPSLKQLCNFLESAAFRLESVRFDSNLSEKLEQFRKRKGNMEFFQASKARKSEGSARAFITRTIDKCGFCDNEHHPTYRCESFLRLETQAKWDAVRNKQLCRNCLRKHKERCFNNNRCRQCGKAHHSLLHNEPKGTVNEVSGSRSNLIANEKTQK